MGKLLFLTLVFVSSALPADAVKVQSTQHILPSAAESPDLIQGIVGVGVNVPSSVALPCIGCFGTPPGTVVVPPPYVIVNALTESSVIYYYVVETGNTGGVATSSFDLVEAKTQKVAQHLTGQMMLPANSSNLVWFTTGVPDNDGYFGADVLVVTTTLGSSTVQGRAYLWVVPPHLQ